MTMTKTTTIKNLQSGATVNVSRTRCSIDGVTVSRKVIDGLMDADKLVFVGKPNNFSRDYKMVSQGEGES